MNINIVELPGAYKIEDGTALCLHEEVELMRACCPGGGRLDCDCRGLDSIICMNFDCTGIEDNDIENLFERFNND